MEPLTAGVDPRTGAPATGYMNWTEHPNNPMAKPAAGIAPARVASAGTGGVKRRAQSGEAVLRLSRGPAGHGAWVRIGGLRLRLIRPTLDSG